MEEFNKPEAESAQAGQAIGFTLDTQIYTRPGELMVRTKDVEQPLVSSRFKANLFWMGHAPMITGKTYKLKLGSSRLPLKLIHIHNVLDASELTTATNKQQIDRHDVAECTLEASKPFALIRSPRSSRPAAW